MQTSRSVIGSTIQSLTENVQVRILAAGYKASMHDCHFRLIIFNYILDKKFLSVIDMKQRLMSLTGCRLRAPRGLHLRATGQLSFHT